MTRDQARQVIGRPLAIWAGLLLLAAGNLGYAHLPGAPIKPLVALALAAMMAALIVWLFMQLRAAAALARMAAAAGLVWASLLYLFAFADYFTR